MQLRPYLSHVPRFVPQVLALSALLAVPVLRAAETARAAEETVELSPFVVTGESETSWVATTTLSGTRTNQELARVPATVDVVTADFMKDLGAFSMEDAAQYVAGLTVDTRLESRNDNGRITYRGLGSSANTSRNFFIWYVPSDTYNVERYDFSKGSNSLMFGDSAPGGQATIYTKRARPSNFARLFTSYASFGAYRVQLDVNEKLRKNLFVRANLVNRRNRTYVRGTNDTLRAGDIAVTYEPFKNTTLRLDAERGNGFRTRADSALAIYDVTSAGRGFGTNNSWYYTSDGEIIQRTSSTPASIDRSAPSGGNQVSLLAGQTRQVRLPNGTYKTFDGYDQYMSILGPGDYMNHFYNVVTVSAEQRIGQLSLEAAYNQQWQDQLRNDVSFGGGSPPVIFVDAAGRPYVERNAGGSTLKSFSNRVNSSRITAAYPFDFGRFGRQFAVVTAQVERNLAFNRRFGYGNAAGPGSIANNGIRYRAYLDDPAFGTDAYWSRFLFQNLPTTPTFKPVLYESFVSSGPFVDLRYARTYSASLSGDYFDGRLTTLVGASWNRLRRKIPGDAAYNTDAQGLVTFPGLPWDNPGAYVYDPSFSLSASSRMAGATYALVRRNSVSVNVYGVYSESFNWQSRPVFWGPDIGPVRGRTKEFGFKGDLLDRKVFYTLAFYQIRRINVPFIWTPDILSLSRLEDLINPNNLLPSDPAYVHVVDGFNDERRTVNSSEQSRGFDFTLQAQRWQGLQARLTFSPVRVRRQTDFTQFIGYLNAAIDRTNKATAPGGDPAMAENPSNITNAQTILGSSNLTDRASGRRSAPYTASFVLDYEIPHVRGLRAGLNGVYMPNYTVTIINGVPYEAGTMFPLNAYIIYDTKILRRAVTFRLGCQNLYDVVAGNSRYRITGSTGTNTGSGQPNFIYRYVEPKVFTLSMEARF